MKKIKKAGKLITPKIHVGINARLDFRGKVLYWADYPALFDSVIDEYENSIRPEHEEEGLFFKQKVKCMDIPPEDDEYYDLLLFDWGGMSLGNDMLGSFCREIIKWAEDNPNRSYIMVSSFTAEAMREAKDSFGEDKDVNAIFNIFLSFKDFIKFEIYLRE